MPTTSTKLVANTSAKTPQSFSPTCFWAFPTTLILVFLIKCLHKICFVGSQMFRKTELCSQWSLLWSNGHVIGNEQFESNELWAHWVAYLAARLTLIHLILAFCDHDWFLYLWTFHPTRVVAYTCRYYSGRRLQTEAEAELGIKDPLEYLKV